MTLFDLLLAALLFDIFRASPRALTLIDPLE
jgi:hypothetical protein